MRCDARQPNNKTLQAERRARKEDCRQASLASLNPNTGLDTVAGGGKGRYADKVWDLLTNAITQYSCIMMNWKFVIGLECWAEIA